MAENKAITVNEIEYNIDDFTDGQKVLLSHVQDLDRKLNNAEFNLNQLMVGREAFIARLAASLEASPEDIAAE
tara:strand:- start:351 stop:569 length:219 start_codon:yes stop_codon:yes gene_type:complete